jgi:hypothetical protein
LPERAPATRRARAACVGGRFAAMTRPRGTRGAKLLERGGLAARADRANGGRKAARTRNAWPHSAAVPRASADRREGSPLGPRQARTRGAERTERPERRPSGRRARARKRGALARQWRDRPAHPARPTPRAPQASDARRGADAGASRWGRGPTREGMPDRPKGGRTTCELPRERSDRARGCAGTRLRPRPTADCRVGGAQRRYARPNQRRRVGLALFGLAPRRSGMQPGDGDADAWAWRSGRWAANRMAWAGSTRGRRRCGQPPAPVRGQACAGLDAWPNTTTDRGRALARPQDAA